MTFVKLILAKTRAPFYLRANLVRSIERNAEDTSQTIVVIDLGTLGQTGYAVANSVENAMAAVLEALKINLQGATPTTVVAEEGTNEPLPVVVERPNIERPDPNKFRSKLTDRQRSS